jgi:ATP-binding cassette subfamily B protein
MALLILGTIVFLCVVMGLAIKFVYPRFKKTRVLTDEVNDVSRENITGVRVIRAYNAEQYQSNKFKKVNDKLTRISIEGQAVLNGLMPLIFTVIDLLNTGIYFLGAWLMKNGELKDTEDIISMAMLSSIVVMNFLMAGMALTSLPQGNISAKRINLVLKEKIDIVSPTKPVTEFNTRGEITFKNVSYRQRGSEENILSDVSFEIKEGETVAIVGKNGAGKSTIANLISRFYDVTSGKIMVDGVDVKHIALPTLRKKIGYINQKSLLFSGTIKDNIMFGLSDTIVEKNALSTAISVSQSKTFINKMKNKEKSNVVQGGNNFSGGQKQRLSIARTLATNPETIIFDDSFSALDFQTDKMLREELNKKYKKTTKVIIAQRIGTILNANKIVVLDNGKVVAVGTHKELFKKCKMYRELALTQMTEKEALHG